MIQIDGSWGEGGGQILRSALTLSVITDKAMHISNIRARRRKPGLMAQHLKAVEAAAAVGNARVEGALPGSTALVFEPHGIHPGEYYFDIGTAGSTSLVLQSILLPLAAAQKVSCITISGGTHVPWSPCFHYLDMHWLPYLRRIGLEAELKMERAGFYPRGGGFIRASIFPAKTFSTLRLTERGKLKKIFCLSAVANLGLSVAERQSRQALQRLSGCGGKIEAKNVSIPGLGKGTMLLILAEFECSSCCYCALGERGKRAERVADEAADAFEAFLATDGAIDEYLADQLLLPLAFAAGRSELRTNKVTQHLATNGWVIKHFLPVEIVIEGEIGRPGLVCIKGGSIAGFR
jgi:RNA 3'-phosphate cyclase